jgi:hypothetical protein
MPTHTKSQCDGLDLPRADTWAAHATVEQWLRTESEPDADTSIDRLTVGSRLLSRLERGEQLSRDQLTLLGDLCRQRLDDVTFRNLGGTRGQKGAVDPMGMEMPLAQLPPADRLPGRVIGEATSGDGKFAVTVLDRPPTGIDRSGSYLAVSARTPYNRYPLPSMSLSGELSRNGDPVFDGFLRPTLDSDLNYHYGAIVDGIRSGDALQLGVGAPPQVARHEGYETAFFEMGPMTLDVP